MVRVLVNGAFGKMGQIACQTVAGEEWMQLVGQTGRTDHLATAIRNHQAQVVIDVTTPTAAFENALTIIQAKAHPIIGTSGLQADQIDSLKKHCLDKRLGGLIAPNFSLGAILMMRYAKEAASYFSQVEIIEAHHPFKVDSPSGTALKTAELIYEANPSLNNIVDTHAIIPGARGAIHQGIPIHALRLSGILAEQQVLFGGSGETLTLSHRTIDRTTYMAGIKLACRKVIELKELVVGLENIL